MATCSSEEDCDAAFRMICKSGYCVCQPGDLFFEWPKYGCFSKIHMFGQCEVSGQCVAMNANTYCNPDNGRCTCSPNFFFNGRECTMRYDNSNLKAQEVYKAAVVAAACFIVAVVGIFVACIVKRSFCRRDQHLQQSDSNRNSDIFSISDEIAALRAVDKPPSYEEVLQIERTFYGIPPPEYTASRSSVYQLPSQQFAPPYAPELSPHQPNPVCAEASNREPVKESDQAVTEGLRPSFPANAPSHFLAAAEVLTPPPGAAENVPSTSMPSIEASSHGTSGRHYSSTPPPCLRRQHSSKPPYTSSSLPSSPFISSHSVGTVLDLPVLLRSELLKSDCQTLALTTPPVEAQNTTSQEGTPSCSNRGDSVDHSNKDSAYALAYDNLGFVSDFHI